MNQSGHIVYILLGGNLNDVEKSFLEAKSKIQETIGALIKESSLYKSPAWGFESKSNFLNQVIVVETKHPALAVLQELLQIETHLGRVRTNSSSGFESRIIDLDILYYDQEIIETEKLTIPHYAIAERRFTLLPLVEINPNFIHPILNQSNKQLLNITGDQSKVEKI